MMRPICKRNGKVILKQIFWVIILVQLSLVSFLAVSFRDGKAPAKLIQENLIGPLLKNGDGVKIKSENSGALSSWKFKNFDLERWEESQKVELKDEDGNLYFRRLPNSQRKCFIEGTDFDLSDGDCHCVHGYYGKDCGIPDAAWFAHFASRPSERKRLKSRPVPRRIIHAVLVNHEIDFFEVRVRSLQDVVDVFLVQESNFTTFGTSKELMFLDKFKSGWLADQQDKIGYVYLSKFAERGKSNGWYADAYIRMYLGKKGIPLVSGLRDDDIFFLSDADELPTREMLLFLKLYDGYTEPIQFGFRWTVFGFFWLKAEDPGMLDNMPLLGKLLGSTKERLLQLYVTCTVGMLRKVYGNNAMLLRRNVWKDSLLAERIHNYTKVEGHVVRHWEAGSLGHYAGYHCSWCYDAAGIRTKLLSAQKHDKPRWGDYPEKTDLEYIKKLVRTGGWFDDTRPFIEVKDHGQRFYAPKYVMDNKEKFKYLLQRPNLP